MLLSNQDKNKKKNEEKKEVNQKSAWLSRLHSDTYEI